MCIRLYSDVVVASKVIDSYERALSLFHDVPMALNEVYISIDSCLTHQAICRNIGIENIFTGPECSFEKEEWNESDYNRFFSLFPQYFINLDNNYYKVNLHSILSDANEDNVSLDIIKESVKEKLLIQGSYSERILSALDI